MADKNLKYSLYRTIWQMLDLIYPPFCGGCNKQGSRWCGECKKNVKLLNGIIVCDICGLPQLAAGVCKTCQAEKPHFRMLRSWAEFQDPIQTALHKLKYRRDMSMGDAVAAEMLPFVAELNWPIDVVIPMPLGRKRSQERGYNQADMVARPLALGLNLQYAPKELIRVKETRSQVGLTRDARRENVQNAFAGGKNIYQKTVLVLDDVATTGATLSSCAAALLSAGAKDVYAITVARALPQHGLNHV